MWFLLFIRKLPAQNALFDQQECNNQRVKIAGPAAHTTSLTGINIKPAPFMVH
jgi:hypothetical protein